MKHPNKIFTNATDSNGYKYHSHLAGISLEIANELQKDNYEVAKQLVELSQSYVSSRISAFRAYIYLYNVYTENSIPKYSVYKIGYMLSIFVYNFIIQAKSSLDLMVCILDCIENQKLKREHELTDFNKYLKSKTINKNLFSVIQDINNQDWISELNLLRNRIVHRGFEIYFDLYDVENPDWPKDKSLIKFHIYKNSTIFDNKNEELEKGLYRYNGCIKSDIDIESLVLGLNQIEEFEIRICETLISEFFTEKLQSYESLRASYGDLGSTILHTKMFSVQ